MKNSPECYLTTVTILGKVSWMLLITSVHKWKHRGYSVILNEEPKCLLYALVFQLW